MRLFPQHNGKCRTVEHQLNRRAISVELPLLGRETDKYLIEVPTDGYKRRGDLYEAFVCFPPKEGKFDGYCATVQLVFDGTALAVAAGE